MTKIIRFPVEKRSSAAEAIRWKAASDTIDQALIAGIERHGLSPEELSGLFAHRLGTLLRNIEDRSKIWDVCEKVLRKQAVLDEI
ncbi:MAG: hypothetical protein OXT67_02705 [Zetaproteobacteria bacterium]|nr:hypothetical protein [Zetaproteobacteria bacterium]